MATQEQEFRQAFARHQAGDLEAAERGYRRVLAQQPNHAEALYLLGSLHAQRLDYAGALPFLERAVALDPRQARFLNNLGIALKETGRWDEADSAYARALALKPDYPEALNNRGILYRDRGLPAEAIAAFRRATAARPDYADAHNNLGLALQAAEEMEEAAECFHRAVTHDPGFAAAHNNRGAVLRLLGRLDEAAAHVEQALALRPDYAEAHNNWGIILHEMQRAGEAEACFRKALALSPDYPDALLNLGASVQAQGRFDEAVEQFERVLALEPHRHDAHFNQGLIRLMRGELAAGWEGYEWRLRDPKAKPPPYRRPRWDGSPLAGRTLLVHAEQGFGDTFQFVRYLPLIPKDGGRVVFECQPGTKALLAGCAGFDELVERPESNVSDDATPHDVQIPLMSLPRLFPHPAAEPPGREPYIHVPVDKVELWRERLAQVSASVPGHRPENLKVGLVWAGNPTHKNDKNRSASLADFTPLAGIPGVTLYSLQLGPAERQAADPPAGMTLVDLAGAIGDFTDTAAVLTHLDLVISVDTSTAHLAGALGRPLWLLVPFVPEWRWMQDREDSPWYPSLRLFRQPERRNWGPVFARVAQELAARAGADAPAAPSVEARAPKISVLMCTYNRLDLLPRVLESYARQTLPPDQYELILVDDASTDGTQEFIQNYKAPFTLIYHRQPINRGIGAARGETVARARGEVVLFADDDETARPDYLEQHLRTHARHPQENYGAHGRIELAPEVADSVAMHVLTDNPGLYHYFGDLPDGAELDFRYFWTNVVSVKRRFIARHAPFDDTTRAQEDVEMGRRLGKSGLVLVHNRQAVLDTLRRMTYAQFCRRQERIGAATAWLARAHGDSDVPFWVGVADVEANMAALTEQFNQLGGVEETMEALERVGWAAVSATPGFLTQTMPELAKLCRARANYLFLAAYVRQMGEHHAQDAACPVVPDTNSLVSVVLSGRGDESETMASLRAQTYPHWETVASLAEAQGAYVLCLEANDTLLPSCLAECIALLERTPGIAFAYGDWERIVEDGGREVAYEMDYRITPATEHVGLPLKSCAVVRRSVCDALGRLPSDGDAWDFWLAAAAQGHSGRRIPKPLVRSWEAVRAPDALHRARLALRYPGLFSESTRRKAQGLLDAQQWQAEHTTWPTPAALVSVILTLSVLDDLDGALAGLKAQTYPRFEVILVNATGTVLVRRVLRQLRQPVNVVNGSPQMTPGAARNRGLRAATGKYVTYLDADTDLAPDHLGTLVTALEQTGYQIAHTGGSDTPDGMGFDYDNILVGSPVPPSALVHSRECLSAIGEFDETLSSGDDWDMAIRLSRRWDVLALPIVTCTPRRSQPVPVRPEDIRAVASVFERHRALLPDAALFTRMQQAVLDQMQARVAATPDAEKVAPKISVLMCTYNRLDLLPRVLESYARQTLPPDQYELILVDDASTDGTGEFLAGYQALHPMTCHRQERNAGIAVGRNRALALARGEVVVFVDDDETARPDYLEQHLRTHARHPEETVAVCGRVELGAEAADSVAMRVLTENPGLYHYFDDLKADRVYDFRRFWGNVVSAKRSFLVRHGGFDDTTQAQEDVELGWRLHPHGLTVRHNPDAVLDTLRVMTLEQFLRRQARIGAASAWLTRKHPHPEVIHWVGVTDAEARLPGLERELAETQALAGQWEVLVSMSWAEVSRTSGFRERTFPVLSAWVKARADREFLSAYVGQLRRDDAHPALSNTSAHVSVITSGISEAGDIAALTGLDAQTHAHWDVTVVDDSEEPSATWNRAAARSTGKYLLRLGPLDTLRPTFLQECVALLERAPELALVYTDASDMDGSLVVPASDYRMTQRPGEPGMPPNTGVVFRRAAWEAAGGWPAGPNPDWHLWRACGERGDIGRRIPKPLLRQRSEAETATPAFCLDSEAARAERLFEAGDAAAALALLHDLNAQYPSTARVLNDLGAISWHQGDRLGALGYFREALAADPQDRTALRNCADARRALGHAEEAERLTRPTARAA